MFFILMAIVPLMIVNALNVHSVSHTFVPADSRPITIQQPNGKMLTFILRGDERISWGETLDGYTLLYNENGFFEFACVDDNKNLVPSGILACNQNERDEQEKNFLETIKPKLFFSKKQIEQRNNRFYQKNNLQK